MFVYVLVCVCGWPTLCFSNHAIFCVILLTTTQIRMQVRVQIATGSNMKVGAYKI